MDSVHDNGACPRDWSRVGAVPSRPLSPPDVTLVTGGHYSRPTRPSGRFTGYWQTERMH